MWGGGRTLGVGGAASAPSGEEGRAARGEAEECRGSVIYEAARTVAGRGVRTVAVYTGAGSV